MDVDVPGSAGLAASVFRVGTSSGVGTLRGRICSHGLCRRKLVHAAPGLGVGRGPDCRQQAPGNGGRAAGPGHDRRLRAETVSAPGFGASPLISDDFLATARAYAELVTLPPSGVTQSPRQQERRKKANRPQKAVGLFLLFERDARVPWYRRSSLLLIFEFGEPVLHHGQVDRLLLTCG